MHVDIFMEGTPVVKAEVNLAILLKLLSGVALPPPMVAQSTQATTAQMADLLSRVDPKSVHFLRAIAANPNGSITFSEMRRIFGLKKDDWAGYSRSYGKGITRAFRHVLGGHKSAKLVWWDDAEWEAGADYDDPRCKVCIDGAALTALRGAV